MIPCKGNAELHDKNGDSEQDIVYVGMLAGHVMTSATFDDVYINDCTIYGGASANSGYGYFGCVENANTHQQANSLGSTVATIRGAGTDAGFGGSVDITSLYGRIQNVLGQSAYGGVNRVTNYPTRETVTATTGGEIPPVTVQATANIGQNSNGNTVYRWTSEGAGNYIGTVSGSYTYLYGLKPAQTTVVTTNSKTGAIVDAWLVAQNGNYLLVNGANVTSTTMNQRASKWIVDENNHWYTLVNGVVYYLNVNNNDEVVASDGLATNATVWQKNEDNELYTVMNGVPYYLYEDGGWKVAPKEETYRITDGANHFLNATMTAVSTGNTEETATGWVVTETDDGTIFHILRNGRPYYLSVNNDALTMSETEFVWSKDGDSYYTGNGEIRYYLTCDNGWKVKALTGTKIHVGTNYLSATTTGTGNATEANAPLWYFETVSDTETRIYTVINGRNYYLTYNGALTVTTTATTWTKDGDAYSIRYANAEYYLAYEEGWTAKPITGYVITDGDGNYMRATGQNQFANTTSLSEATLFTFSNTTGNPRGTISYRIGA